MVTITKNSPNNLKHVPIKGTVSIIRTHIKSFESNLLESFASNKKHFSFSFI